MSGKPPDKNERTEFDFGEEFDEIEVGPMSEAEYEAAELEHEVFLARERVEHEELAHGLEAELDALIETIKSGEPQSPAEAARPDPPGWPDL